MSSPSDKSTTTKAFRFGLIGIANAVVDFAVFGLAMAAGFLPVAANLAGWAAAVTFSFAANSKLTFTPAQNRSRISSYLRFAGSGALITLGVSTLAVWIGTPLIGAWAAKFAGIAVAGVINFFAARWSIE